MRIFGFTAYGGPEATSVMEVPDPTPGPGQLLVRTAAAGVNPADVKVRNGDRIGAVPVTFPMAMGREAAGTVVAHQAHAKAVCFAFERLAAPAHATEPPRTGVLSRR